MVDKKLVKWLQLLATRGRMTLSSCPTNLQDDVERLISRNLLCAFNDKKRLYVEISDKNAIKELIDDNSVVLSADTPNRAASIAEHGDSKSGKPLDTHLLQFRSRHEGALLRVGDVEFDPQLLTKMGGSLGILQSNINPKPLSYPGKLYLIENMECWAHAEDYLPHDGLYLRYEGWLSERMINWLGLQQFSEIVLSPDYDLVGLHNWLKIKSIISGSKLHFPNNFELLIKKHQAIHLWKKQQGYLEKVCELLGQYSDEKAALWFEKMATYGCCLEQEALLIKKVAH
jgi:hypothetical protein